MTLVPACLLWPNSPSAFGTANSKCLFVRAAAMQSHMNSDLFNPKGVSPLCKRARNPVTRQSDRVSAVTRLISACRPAAILWLVATINVVAFQGHAGRALAHVSQECLEGIPATTNRDAASAIVGKVLEVRIVAPPTHFDPAVVGSGLLTHSREPMCRATAANSIWELHCISPMHSKIGVAGRRVTGFSGATLATGPL